MTNFLRNGLLLHFAMYDATVIADQKLGKGCIFERSTAIQNTFCRLLDREPC